MKGKYLFFGNLQNRKLNITYFKVIKLNNTWNLPFINCFFFTFLKLFTIFENPYAMHFSTAYIHYYSANLNMNLFVLKIWKFLPSIRFGGIFFQLNLWLLKWLLMYSFNYIIFLMNYIICLTNTCVYGIINYHIINRMVEITSTWFEENYYLYLKIIIFI